ncbi:hypothetical protein CICLE_v10013194mg [Citrus x clementina]|uniref:Uncharacterized protein n=1 Tax=Citrus clementina TaxID=85681 RepID=V4UT64_CITCL|nr:hypothetical protein CICLE_v10013194mg [Citrus x clementina]GAY32221.1 hypothetical protein CUMW_001210 [Citrus unshiu]
METTAHDVRGSKSQVKNYYNCINMKAEAEPPVHTMTMLSLSFLRFPKIFVSLPPHILNFTKYELRLIFNTLITHFVVITFLRHIFKGDKKDLYGQNN